jgi:hypothetical protein
MRKRSLAVGIAVGAVLVPAVALAAVSLSNFTARAGEETGFAPQGRPVISPTARSWVAGEPARQHNANLARLQREGFVSAVTQQMRYLRNPKKGGGLSWVIELGSSTAARAEQRVELRQIIAAQGKAKIRHLAVPGVPGATAFAATEKKYTGGAANALFTEGPCLVLVGDSVLVGNYTAPVIAGARAVYRRTGGRCP